MSVKSNRKVDGVGRLEYAVSARDLLNNNHPLRNAFVNWLGDKEPTKRQAAKFLQRHPHYREIKHGQANGDS